MKLFHLSDLHLGKRVNGFSMLEDQEDILGKILRLVREERPDAVLLAGDLYDKPVPPAEAVALLDSFLAELAEQKTAILLLSGNHDSAERVAFGGRILRAGGVYVAPAYQGHVEPVVLEDAFGPVYFYLLPYLRPAMARPFFPGQTVETAQDAVRAAVEEMRICPEHRNVLGAHQFVLGALRSDSEEVAVGGLDQVDAAVFAGFDYAALGHLHRPQAVGAQNRIRYAGSPLAYSFSEAGQEKSVTVVELGEKGALSIRMVPLQPLRRMTELKGPFARLVAPGFAQAHAADYIHVSLTDEQEIPEAVGRLRAVYPYLMRLDYDNTRTRRRAQENRGTAKEQSPFELFSTLYERQNNSPLSARQAAFVQKRIEEIWGGEA